MGINLYLNKAIVEEEADGGRSSGRRIFELLRDDGADDLFKVRACFGVVIHREVAVAEEGCVHGSGVGSGRNVVYYQERKDDYEH